MINQFPAQTSCDQATSGSTGRAVGHREISSQFDGSSFELVDATKPRYDHAQPACVNLGYRIRAVRTFEHMAKVCELRERSFGRRQPELAHALRNPEPADFEPGNLILMAIRKATGEVVGTARMHTNLNSPLEYETHIELPAHFRGLLLGGCSRLAVDAGPDSANVTRMLFKTFYWFSLAQQVSRLLITAEPPRDRLYKLFGFRDVFPGRLFRTESTPQYGCKLLSLELATVDSVLAEVNPGFLAFLEVHTPEIEIFSSAASGMWAAPRQNERKQIAGAIPGLHRATGSTG